MTLKMFRSTMTEIGTPTSHRTSDLIMTSCRGMEGVRLNGRVVALPFREGQRMRSAEGSELLANG
jgi:hypothetical protein